MPATSSMNGLLWLSIAAFFGGLIYTMIIIGQTTASGDGVKDMQNAIAQVAGVNCVLILVLGGTAYFYTSQQTGTGTKDAYIMFMLHLSILLSVTSISVSTLFKKSA